MKKYIKTFMHRGLIFGGFGPIVAAIVFFILGKTLDNFSLSGNQIFLATLSTYLLAFVQAGASVFNEIEEWPITKSLLCHFSLLFLAYSATYILNSWIPFEPVMILLFSLIFIVSYFIIWFSVYFAVRSTSKSFNKRLSEKS